MREISSDEIYKLADCLHALAAHHNKISVHFKGHYPKTPVEQTLENFVHDVEKKKSYISVIEQDHQIIGFCKINVNDGIGTIEYLIVLEAFRGQGHGAALMEWALKRFADFNIRTIDVKVADGNDAVTMYEKFGFRMNAHILRLCK